MDQGRASPMPNEMSRASPAPSDTFSVHESVWVRQMTEDNRVYFFNRATGASQWHIPNELYHGRHLVKDLEPDEDLLVMPATARAHLGNPRGIGVACITEVPPWFRSQGISDGQPLPRVNTFPERRDDLRGSDLFTEDALDTIIPKGIPLKIVIHSARGLRDTDFMPGKDKSDPYCTVEVFGKPNLRLQTPVVSDELDPVWEHECAIPGVFDGDILLFQVFDFDGYDIVASGGRKQEDDLLGKVMVPVEEIRFGKPVEMELQDVGRGHKAFITVSVSQA